MLARKPSRERERKCGKKEGRPNADYDLFLLDGASSEQSAGEFLEHRAPWSTKVRCGMQLGYSRFNEVADIPSAAWFNEDHTKMYDWFGAMRHQVHAMLKKTVAGVQQGQARRGHQGRRIPHIGSSILESFE